MSWFKKLLPSKIGTDNKEKKGVPEGLWIKCPSCEKILYKAELQRNLGVCPKCQYHTRLGARRRLDIFLDSENREEVARDIEAGDPLKFRDFKRHKDRVLSAKKKTKEKSALLVMRGELFRTINVVLSKGMKMIKMPLLIGTDLELVKSQMETLGLKLGKVSKYYNQEIRKGVVISTVPAAGEDVTLGGSVDLDVSLGNLSGNTSSNGSDYSSGSDQSGSEEIIDYEDLFE